MKKSNVKGLSLMLVMVLCLSLLPVPALAASGDFTIEHGVLTQYNGAGGDVVIPDGVTSIGDSAFRGCTRMERVSMGSGVTSIGLCAFVSCYRLQSITIPSSVTDMDVQVFNDCADNFTIYGEAGSAAEAYATRYKYNFAGLGDVAPGVETAAKWAQEDINIAYRGGLVPAALQSSYSAVATRAEFCALAVALYETVEGTELTERERFTDTSDVNVEKMAALGVVNGVGDGKFTPNDTLTREQAATMLARLADAMDNPLRLHEVNFADKADISPWALEGVSLAQTQGIMQDIGDNIFAPKTGYTREQCIVTMLRLYQFVSEEAAARL